MLKRAKYESNATRFPLEWPLNPSNFPRLNSQSVANERPLERKKYWSSIYSKSSEPLKRDRFHDCTIQVPIFGVNWTLLTFQVILTRKNTWIFPNYFTEWKTFSHDIFGKNVRWKWPRVRRRRGEKVTHAPFRSLSWIHNSWKRIFLFSHIRNARKTLSADFPDNATFIGPFSRTRVWGVLMGWVLNRRNWGWSRDIKTKFSVRKVQ